MAGLIFSHAKAILRKAEKFEDDMLEMNPEGKGYKQVILDQEMRKFTEILKIASDLNDIYRETIKAKSWFFITIRPDVKRIDFGSFYRQVCKYISRKPFIEFSLTFEQTGSGETLGDGFHIHIVADTRWRSKGECIRDTYTSFKDMLEINCIDVRLTKNPNDIVENYMIAYDSKDEHKIIHKNDDSLWRTLYNLRSIYDNLDPPRESVLTSPVRQILDSL